MTARKALNQSYNIPAIDIFLNKVGINEAWDFAKKLGITSIQKEDYVCADRCNRRFKQRNFGEGIDRCLCFYSE